MAKNNTIVLGLHSAGSLTSDLYIFIDFQEHPEENEKLAKLWHCVQINGDIIKLFFLLLLSRRDLNKSTEDKRNFD